MGGGRRREWPSPKNLHIWSFFNPKLEISRVLVGKMRKYDRLTQLEFNYMMETGDCDTLLLFNSTCRLKLG